MMPRDLGVGRMEDATELAKDGSATVWVGSDDGIDVAVAAWHPTRQLNGASSGFGFGLSGGGPPQC
jgi:hypothetical protein